MAFSFTTIIKGLLVKQEGTLTPTAVELVPGGTASTTTVIQGAQTANRTLTLPDATDTLTANATAQALTNKDLSGAGNTFPTFNQNTTGTAANITASSNSTLTTLSALSLPGAQVTGNISGNAANITASSNSTLTTLSALSLPGAQVTGNISGNAANITASSNSTLTTLSALSLPGAQITGNISGNAANITASSNSTLTTLSALSLPLSQTTGVASIAQGGTNNGSLGVTAGGAVYTDGTKLQTTAAGTSGQALISNGASAPSFQTISAFPIVNAKYQLAAAQSFPITTYTTIAWDTKVIDSAGSAMNTSTGVYTFPSTGVYSINATFFAIGVGSANYLANLRLRINGTVSQQEQNITQGGSGVSTTISDLVSVTAGDTLDIQYLQNQGTEPASGSVLDNWITITRVA